MGNKYAQIKSVDHIGLVILYKKELSIKYEGCIRLENAKNRDPDRFGLFFLLNSIRVCTTHLEVGQKFQSRSGSTTKPEGIKNILKWNSDIRLRQLE